MSDTNSVPPTPGAQRAGLFFSFAALIVSLISLYFSALFQQNDVRFVIDEAPKVRLDLQTRELEVVDRELNLTLINAGNRTVAITEVLLIFSQHNQGPRREYECYGQYDVFAYGGVPFAIKPGDVLTKSFLLERNAQGKANNFRFALTEVNDASENGRCLVATLGFRLLTPEKQMHPRMTLYRMNFSTEVPVGEPPLEYGFHETHSLIKEIMLPKWDFWRYVK